MVSDLTSRVDAMLAAMSPDQQYTFLRAVSTLKKYGGDALSMLRLQDYQVKIVKGRATVTIVRGGNRSGKSLVMFAIIAHVFTGLPLLDRNGVPLPPFIDHSGPHVIWTIGTGEKHIGQTIHRYLFRPGAFKVLPDEKTGELRAYRPWDKADHARRRETRPAPPLIPERFILGGEPKYSDRGRNIFEHIEGHDGSFLYAFTSTGDVKMGDPVTLLAIDEDVKYSSYVPEWYARLEDPWARMIWAAFPHQHTTALRLLSRQALAEKDMVEKGQKSAVDIEEFQLFTKDNSHIEDEVKKRRASFFLAFGEAELAARDRGEFNDELVEMFPNFSHFTHAAPAATEDLDDPVDRELRRCEEEGTIIPEDWSLDVIVDPGHSHPGALVVAMTPQKLWQEFTTSTGITIKEPIGVVVGLVYQPRTGAREMALSLRGVLEFLGNRKPERFIIDWHAARQSYQGMGGYTVLMHYSKEFEEAGMESVYTGSGFQMSSDNIEADLMEVRRWIAVPSMRHGRGRPRLRFLANRCQEFSTQMENYKKTVTKDISTDKPANGQISPLCDCIRYWVASQPQHSVVVEKMQTTAAERRWKAYENERVEFGEEYEDDAIYCGVPR